jgi:hypothetical protein
MPQLLICGEQTKRTENRLRWPASFRNGGRDQIGMAAGIKSESLAGLNRNSHVGQRAMATAMLYPTAEHGGARKKGSSFSEKLENTAGTTLSKARTVLRDQALAERVLAGTLSLDDAYDEVRRDAVEQRAGRRVKLTRGAQVHADSRGR